MPRTLQSALPIVTAVALATKPVSAIVLQDIVDRHVARIAQTSAHTRGIALKAHVFALQDSLVWIAPLPAVAVVTGPVTILGFASASQDGVATTALRFSCAQTRPVLGTGLVRPANAIAMLGSKAPVVHL